MQPVGEEQVSVVEREHQVGDQAGHAALQRPALQRLVLDVDHRLRRPRAVVAMEALDRARQRDPDEALSRVGIVLPAQLQRDPAVVAEIERLHLRALLEIPEVQLAPVLAGADVGRVKAVLEGVGRAPLARHERVLARLVPEVVHELECAGSFSQRPAIEKSRASRIANPPGALPSASPSIEIVMMSPGMQCTVCGALRPSFSLISSPSITFLIRGERGSEMSSMWIRAGAEAGHDQRVARTAASGTPTSTRSSRSGAARRRRWACRCAPRPGRSSTTTGPRRRPR